jgi:hypothetical protein
MKKKKQRRCRICKKRPVWTRGDVKDPGPVCKCCYHKHVWPDRKVPRGRRRPIRVTTSRSGHPTRKRSLSTGFSIETTTDIVAMQEAVGR